MRLDEEGQLILTEEEKATYLSGVGNRLYRLLEAAFKDNALNAQGSLVTFSGDDLTPFEAGRRIGQFQAETMLFQKITDRLKGLSEEPSEGEEVSQEDDMGELL